MRPRPPVPHSRIRIEAGTRLLGRFVGVSRPDEESLGHWIVERVEGRVRAVPEPAWLADWRSQKLEPGDVVSLLGSAPAADAPRPPRGDRGGTHRHEPS